MTAPTRDLAGGCVEIWFAALDGTLDDVQSMLSSDELERARRFRFDRDRNRYAIGRGLLRALLASYVGRSPSEIRFTYNAFGKPSALETSITFNVSHSGARAMFAFGHGLELGVDIEELTLRRTDREVAEQFFSKREVDTLLALRAEEQGRAFLQCWTRKEAFLKGHGEGLSLPLHDFEVEFAPGRTPALLRTAWSASEPRLWRLFDLSSHGVAYVAALAVRAPDVTLLVHDDAWADDGVRALLPSAFASRSQVAPQSEPAAHAA